MKAFAAAVLIVTVSMVVPPPARAVPDTTCELKTDVVEVTHLAQLPPALTALIGPIAEIGSPFNSTDAVRDPSLPFRRLIRAGHRGSDWFVWYEHGGIGYFWQAVVVRVGNDGSANTLANAGTISNTLCAITDGALTGRVLPYPEGAWAADS
jgi:hypothetical protein